MNVSAFKPISSLLAGFIESYFVIETDVATEVKTLLNGRIDASIVVHGDLEWYYLEEAKFTALPACTLYPPTRVLGRARSLSASKCISVKFFPHLIAHSIFQHKKLHAPLAFHEFFGSETEDKKLVINLSQAVNPTQTVELLDTYFERQLLFGKSDPWINEVISLLGNNEWKVAQVAVAKGISIKTLERRFVKAMGITPQFFSKVIQLQQTVGSIRNLDSQLSHGDLIEALGNGYYDQAHFTKSCKRITGLTPKKLFAQLTHPMTDLLVVTR
jgi:AraC-like DNA-binding protein